MKILLDENLPASLLSSLRRLGHQVDSVNSLCLKGIDNGALYRLGARDVSCAHRWTRGGKADRRTERFPRESTMKVLIAGGMGVNGAVTDAARLLKRGGKNVSEP